MGESPINNYHFSDFEMTDSTLDLSEYNVLEINAIPEGLQQWEIKSRQIDNILYALAQLGIRCDYLVDDVDSIKFKLDFDPPLYSYERDTDDSFIYFDEPDDLDDLFTLIDDEEFW
ncbi:hypothetical protein [Chaco virus]|uniref:Uncharacterized protein n=1 Tax=Chaco virus TaxID=1158189 RepID=A0A0D3R135_9RHAB|nr:hypothetical protein [Chaco virus]AJR28414.1 hypothetical protein [Chaco virus]